MQVDLTREELNILMVWAEEATSPKVGVGSSYLTQAEMHLLEKLQRAVDQSAQEDESPVGSPRRPEDARSDH